MARIETPGASAAPRTSSARSSAASRTCSPRSSGCARLYCFQRVDVPVFEDTQVFARSIGETTDVVSKEMYTFPDRGGDLLTLRPEFTAGHRARLSDRGVAAICADEAGDSGPVFRYERPQKGRYRQFHQIDAEVIGAAEPAADVELLVMADQLLHELGIADGVTLAAQHAGRCRDARRVARGAGRAFRGASRGAVSEDSLTRLDKNPLRILDSKDPRDRPIADARARHRRVPDGGGAARSSMR